MPVGGEYTKESEWLAHDQDLKSGIEPILEVWDRRKERCKEENEMWGAIRNYRRERSDARFGPRDDQRSLGGHAREADFPVGQDDVPSEKGGGNEFRAVFAMSPHSFFLKTWFPNASLRLSQVQLLVMEMARESSSLQTQQCFNKIASIAFETRSSTFVSDFLKREVRVIDADGMSIDLRGQGIATAKEFGQVCRSVLDAVFDHAREAMEYTRESLPS